MLLLLLLLSMSSLLFFDAVVIVAVLSLCGKCPIVFKLYIYDGSDLKTYL